MPRLLIVDDNAMMLRTIQRVIHGWREFDHSFTSSIDESLEAVSRGGVDVVLFDVCMPREDDCLPLVMTAKSRHPSLGLVAMSGRAHRAAVAKLLKLGVDEYWEKWTSPSDLRAKLNAAAARAVLERTSDADQPDLRALAATAVGSRSLREAQTALGDAMIEMALHRAGGNRSLAARMLGITPQAIRHRERARPFRGTKHGQD